MGEYVLICPICKWETEDTYKSMFSVLKNNLAVHVMSKKDHRKVVAEWFRNNKKNWNYVRREVIRLLSSGRPVAISLAGEAYSFSRKEFVEKLKSIRDPENFIETLYEVYREADMARSSESKSANETFQRFANYYSLLNLVDWIGIYWIEHNMIRVNSREEVPVRTNKVVYIEDR